MKYLKLFENLHYFKMSLNEWTNLCGLDIFRQDAEEDFYKENWVKFNDQELFSIMSLFPNCNYSYVINSIPEIRKIVPKASIYIEHDTYTQIYC
jgi:hypothetical protein